MSGQRPDRGRVREFVAGGYRPEEVLAALPPGDIEQLLATLPRQTPQVYGELLCTRHDDGRVIIDRADPVIGVSPQLLADPDLQHVAVDPAGNLVFARQAAYRPVGFAPNRVLVCVRVW
ncbi:MAG TPA: hypothetical protein VFM37_13520 [Pseudonocardiaceae bacterium]|nr:hypothetical protein [Pseudonocardiaceae bacterium]